MYIRKSGEINYQIGNFFLSFASADNIINFELNFVMQTITIRNIKISSHRQTKTLFWHLFVATRGGQNRIRIINQLRIRPSNKNQLSQDLSLDYKLIEHHLDVLMKNNVVTKLGSNYGATYFISTLFEDAEQVFDEIVEQLKKIGGNEWLV